MKNKKVEMLYVNVQNPEVPIEEFIGLYHVKPTLEFYYELIGCRLITHYDFYLNENHYTVICDDEGLLVDNPRFSLFINGQPTIAGHCFITRFNENGENIGLTHIEQYEIVSRLELLEIITPISWYRSYDLDLLTYNK